MPMAGIPTETVTVISRKTVPVTAADRWEEA